MVSCGHPKTKRDNTVGLVHPPTTGGFGLIRIDCPAQDYPQTLERGGSGPSTLRPSADFCLLEVGSIAVSLLFVQGCMLALLCLPFGRSRSLFLFCAKFKTVLVWRPFFFLDCCIQ